MNQQQLNKIDEEFGNKFSCIHRNCDNNGTIAEQVGEDEWEPVQCQFCCEILLPFKLFLYSKLQETYTQGARDSEAYKNMLDESQKTFEAIMEARKKGFADGINLHKISTPSCVHCGSSNLNTEYEMVGGESFKYLHCLNCGFNHEHVQI